MSHRRGGSPVDPLSVFRLVVFRVEPGKTAIVRILAESYGGCFTHWDKGRTWYCPGDDQGCLHHKSDHVWKGYCAAEVYDQAVNRWAPIVLEITEHLELDFRGVFDRGQVWQLSRAVQVKARKATPVVGRLLEERDPDTFPQPHSIKEVLQTMYHVPLVMLDKKNPLPPRQLVTHSEGEPPRCLTSSAEAQPVSEQAVKDFKAKLRDRINGPVNGTHPA